MTVARPISVSKSLDLLNQKSVAFSRLTKREVEEVNVASTRYPIKKQSVININDSSDRSHKRVTSSSTNATTDGLEREKKTDQQQSSTIVARQKEKNLLVSKNFLCSSEKKSSVASILDEEKEDDLCFYHQKEELFEYSPVDVDLINDERHHDHLPSASSLVGGVTALLSQVKPFFQPDQPSLSFDDNLALKNKKQTLIEQSLFLSDQPSAIGSNLSVNDSTDTGDDANFSRAQQEHVHEIADKMGEKENEGNSFIAAKTIMAHLEIAPATGTSGSTEAYQPDSITAALRVTHLLNELTATVGRLRLESGDGKEMTIQVRRDVLADTNIHIVSTGKQMEVSFLTSNATSNLLLNTHLTTLQNHLNSLCPGQVVNVQTQLTPSSSSSHLGNEQDRSHDDLASFDQGNRGNFTNDDDHL